MFNFHSIDGLIILSCLLPYDEIKLLRLYIYIKKKVLVP